MRHAALTALLLLGACAAPAPRTTYVTPVYAPRPVAPVRAVRAPRAPALPPMRDPGAAEGSDTQSAPSGAPEAFSPAAATRVEPVPAASPVSAAGPAPVAKAVPAAPAASVPLMGFRPMRGQSSPAL